LLGAANAFLVSSLKIYAALFKNLPKLLPQGCFNAVSGIILTFLNYFLRLDGVFHLPKVAFFLSPRNGT